MARIGTLIRILSLAVVSPAIAAHWQPDGSALCTTADEQLSPVPASDGAGGAIIAWLDRRTGTYQVYVQRITTFGAIVWTANGVPLTAVPGARYQPRLVSDGTGGAIVTWFDLRGGTNDIYAQRVNASGSVMWAANGVALCAAVGDQIAPVIISDGAGGAIVTWVDFRSGGVGVYAQRINASGAVQWPANGVPVALTAPYTPYNPGIVPDGAGGALVAWDTSNDVYAQRINPSGVVQWAVNGVALTSAANTQMYSTIISDGSGGAIVTWEDYRSGTDFDIYAQRINGVGTPQWTSNGVALCTASSDQDYPKIASDAAGGAIVTWQDGRFDQGDIYVQRVTASGGVAWTPNGVPLCTATYSQYYPVIASDGIGGAIVVWDDVRDFTGNIYMQRIHASGSIQWASDGAPLCNAAGAQASSAIVADGAGGSIVVWSDYRSEPLAPDVYAQRVEGTYGYWGHPEPAVTSVADVPNDQGGKVAVNWTASGRDLPVPATIDYYSIWRAVDASALVAGEALTAIEHVGPDTPPHVHATAPSGYYWELVGTQTAYRWANYSFSTQTRSDSVAGNPGTEFFMVAAHAVTDEHIAFASNAVSGHSVDNLAPAAPLYLTAHRIGTDVQLKWNRVRVADLRDYSVYRKTMAGVTPLPANFLSSVEDTVMVDAAAPSSALYYIVTADDVHRNQSPPSNEASVSATTHVGNSPSITRLTVLPNHPNPFSGETEIDIGLPANSDVEIELYDVAGRRVRETVLPERTAGWHRIVLGGFDDGGRELASGVYFCKVTANGTTITRKMVIAR